MIHYRGRFAPTPSGPLHFGSLFAAVVSFLDARANNGSWFVRIEDIDPPREQPGSTQSILKTLQAHGLEWDGPVTYQSDNSQRYLNNLEKLAQDQRLYWCNCSRKSLTGSLVYPGYCRHKQSPETDHAARLKIATSETDYFIDYFQGPQQANIASTYGDVVLRRRDGLFSYQLAVVSDDIAQGITHIVRGVDLLSSTFWQRELTRYLSADFNMPLYGHFPVVHASGADFKLSKQNLATAVTDDNASLNLQAIFSMLDIYTNSHQPTAMLNEAIHQWRPEKIRFKQSLHKPNFELDSR